MEVGQQDRKPGEGVAGVQQPNGARGGDVLIDE
jgi:hypothetical protein